ncbi:ATP-binding protein [Ruicaihuangia caeni]|uniref:Histidine kinase n=1 Tax=Ruicaihuangia caeni TaxID=3042517 RepID=A0AAW6T8C8_9MICO|nr:ATP-binding protein [Klugiella sp. YN-L-19]MDI2099361.1 histidine kinase [Klugiella sp. YN-L-19]
MSDPGAGGMNGARQAAPKGSDPRQVRSPISRRAVESVISRSVAVFGLVFGAQTVPAMLAQMDGQWSSPFGALAIALFAMLVVAFVASMVRRFVRIGHAAVAIAYVLTMLARMTMVDQPFPDGEDNHWLYFLLTVATATAAIGFSRRVAGVYLVAVPVLYGVFRMLPVGGARDPLLAVLDVIYAIILGGAVMIIVTMLRQAADSVDVAQGTALQQYGAAVRQHATELERVEVDAIVHDSVLTTLLSAASAETPSAKALAAGMARAAIGHLADAAENAPGVEAPVQLTTLACELSEAAAALAEPVRVVATRLGDSAVPAVVVEAVRSAALQALVNSIQHAGKGLRPGKAVHRWMSISAVEPGGVVVEVGDDGTGFRFEALPRERLGVRVSIIERLAKVGGAAEVLSAPGRGTVIRLVWCGDAASQPEVPQLDVTVGGEERQ